MSIFSRATGFLMRHPLLTWFVIIPAIIYIALVATLLASGVPTYEQLKAMDAAAERNAAAAAASQQASEQARAAAAAANLEQDKYFCRLEPVCEKYGKVRQECATAGSFDNCIKVKMGDDDAGLIDACTNDGNVLYPSEHMPNGLRCFVLRHLQ